MPRLARIVIPNCPHHVIQRGHNRNMVFAHEDDYKYYLATLKEWKTKLSCKIYAYCLMTNHVHLVIDPGDKPENLGLLMKRLAGRQTRYVNRLEGRSGSLWEGRYKSSPVEKNNYLVSCCRYVELNPLRAEMVKSPWEYRWSSCREKVGLEKNIIVDFDEYYLSFFEKDSVKGVMAYEKWLLETIPPGELELIRSSVQRNQLTGTDLFQKEISLRLGMRIENRPPGRPKK